MNTYQIKKNNTKMIAHRGLSKIECENTIAAFIAACNRSYFGTECDIHLTKDKVFVLSHDHNTQRLSSVDKVISESTFVELQEVTLYEYGTNIQKQYLKIPSLAEYIFVSKKYQKKCFIELKPAFSYEELEQLINEINAFDYLDHSIFISFNYQNLIKLRELKHDIHLQYLIGNNKPDDLLERCINIQTDIDIYYQSLTREDVDIFHQNKIKVNVWTVDNCDCAERLISWGVDFITTNILE